MTHYTQTICVPNMATFAREVTDHGMTGAILQRYMRLTAARKLRLLFHFLSLRSLLLIMKRDFPFALRLLCEFDLLYTASADRFKIGIHEDVVDLALAFDSVRTFTYIYELASTYNTTVVLFTHNPQALRALLTQSEVAKKLSIRRVKR